MENSKTNTNKVEWQRKYDKDIADLERKLEEERAVNESYKSQIRGLSIRLHYSEKTIKKRDQTIDKLQKYMEDLEQESNALKDKNEVLEKQNEELETEIESLTEQLKELKETTIPQLEDEIEVNNAEWRHDFSQLRREKDEAVEAAKFNQQRAEDEADHFENQYDEAKQNTRDEILQQVALIVGKHDTTKLNEGFCCDIYLLMRDVGVIDDDNLILWNEYVAQHREYVEQNPPATTTTADTPTTSSTTATTSNSSSGTAETTSRQPRRSRHTEQEELAIARRLTEIEKAKLKAQVIYDNSEED